MSNERVVKLLRGHRVRIARALVRQTRALAPRYEQLDESGHERSFMALLVGVERLLERGEEGPLMGQAASLAQLRAAMGFQLDDFVCATLGFLPVLRRFIVENAKSIAEGLDDYEEFESVALPLIGRAATIFLDAKEDPTMPNGGRAPKYRDSHSGPVRPLRIERVTGSAEDEELYKDHPLFSSRG